MGWWKTGNGDDVTGDGPADIVGEAFRHLAGLYLAQGQALFSLPDFLSALLVVLNAGAFDTWEDGHRFHVRLLRARVDPADVWISSDAGNNILSEGTTILEACAEQIMHEYLNALDRKPRLTELLAAFRFVLGYQPERYLSISPETTIAQIDAIVDAVAYKREAMMVKPSTEIYVQVQKDIIAKHTASIQDPACSPAQREVARRNIFDHCLYLLIARYSRGESIAMLQQEFPSVVKALAAYREEPYAVALNFDDLEQYILSLWAVSLAYLLEVDEALFEQLVSLIGQSGRDALFDELVSLRSSVDSKASALLHPAPYRLLYRAITSSSEERDALVMQFLSQYYPNMQVLSWYNLHLTDPEHFFGYWCFELAAFVKGLGVDDAVFADNYYYPRDLTGQYLFRTWAANALGEQDRAQYHQLNPQHEPFLVLYRD